MPRTHPIERIRRICLALPEAAEQETWDAPTFRVRNKIFAMVNHGELAIWCKAPTGAQDILVNDDPDRYFVPPYVGHHGWIGIRLRGKVDWDDVRDLIEESYRMTASKRLLQLLESHRVGE